jgi:hypothetical protein
MAGARTRSQKAIENLVLLLASPRLTRLDSSFLASGHCKRMWQDPVAACMPVTDAMRTCNLILAPRRLIFPRLNFLIRGPKHLRKL